MAIPDVFQIVVAIVISLGPAGLITLAANEPSPMERLTGTKFRQELERPLTANSTQSELRQFLGQIAADRRISVLLDRRLDPSIEFPVDLKSVSLRTGLANIASKVNGELALTENTVFLGPKSATTRLRTLIELRSLELKAKDDAIPDRRRSDLQRRQTMEWQDLDAPRDILEMIAARYRLKIANAQVIPHDLWAATTLPEVSLVEALSMILIQFDLTFQWADAGNAIELIPIPDRIFIERKHRSKQKRPDAMALIRRQFPGLDAEASNSEILVRGLIEEHEAVSKLLRGDVAPRTPKIDLPQDLRRQMFTYSSEFPIPLIAVIKKLEESEIRFEYDPDELKAAGIDLEKTIQINVKNVSASDFFKAIFDPNQFDVQLDHSSVKLKPKKEKQKK